MFNTTIAKLALQALLGRRRFFLLLAFPVLLIGLVALVTALVDGWKAACETAGATWGGGESPALKDLVVGGEIDLAGAAVGVVPEGRAPIMGADIAPGDVIVLLPTDGAALTEAATKAMQAGIPVVNVDREFSSPFAARTTILGDNYGMGVSAGTYASPNASASPMKMSAERMRLKMTPAVITTIRCHTGLARNSSGSGGRVS